MSTARKYNLTTPVKQTINNEPVPDTTATLEWLGMPGEEKPTVKIIGTRVSWYLYTLLGFASTFRPTTAGVPKMIAIDLGTMHVCTNIDELVQEALHLVTTGARP